ncbi:recombinase family protein [Streptomyces sp. 6-11-2]|uniref:recombinase family protein n=1 Tax=Streptomyces sp. 6-11-2 TaxID=2585753 RepID=UPI00209C63E3|nr:recombinase family protein [Streptomyces sp. 6-11-2]
MSTDQQSTARQNLVLDEAGIEAPVVFEEDPGTSSRLYPLQRPKFRELLTYARPGDTVHISEMSRLVRGTQHILGHCHVGKWRGRIFELITVEGDRPWGARRRRTRGTGTRSRSSPTVCGCTSASRSASARSRS